MKIRLVLLVAFGAMACLYSCKKGATPTPVEPVSSVMGTPVPDQALNDAARFVAGLPIHNEESKLYALTQSEEWKSHARNMDQIWVSYQQSATKMASFTLNELSGINKRSRYLFYPFGGPDYLFAGSFFPEADTYFLIGLERTGHPIQVKHPSSKTYKLYQDAVSDVLSLSFFPTRDRKVEQVNDTIDGVVPVISMLMARMDREIISIEYKSISKEGEIVDTDEDTGLVEIRFFRKGTGKQQTLYYYATDLSNAGLQENGELLAYIKKLKRKSTTTFIKSASYLMYEDEFSMIRELILDRSRSIVQDDSGIPLHFYKPEKWETVLYGTYDKPTAPYAAYTQPRLRDMYKKGDPKPLGFRIGFARQSNLQKIERK